MFNNESAIVPLIFKNEGDRHFFQFVINSQLASIEYKMIGEDRMLLSKMHISKCLKMEEVGNALIERVLDYVHRTGLQIVPLCPIIRLYIHRNKRYQKLVAMNIHYGKY